MSADEKAEDGSLMQYLLKRYMAINCAYAVLFLYNYEKAGRNYGK